ncbi:MAG: 2-isopropylmalate synthase, partial [Alphaproteobacteria bacterium]|nr:2-isopropylmalate synthase [Alphaproteobacteria bacterium]
MSAHDWSGASYTGDVECGWYSGHGVYRFKNGTEYEGEFVKGQFHGRGVLRFPEGCLEGEFAFGRAVNV